MVLETRLALADWRLDRDRTGWISRQTTKDLEKSHIPNNPASRDNNIRIRHHGIESSCPGTVMLNAKAREGQIWLLNSLESTILYPLAPRAVIKPSWSLPSVWNRTK